MVKKASQKSQKKKSVFLSIAVGCGAIIILSLSIFNLALYSSQHTKNALGLKIESNTNNALLRQRLFWQTFLEENPMYLPGWIELAKVEVQLENPKAAMQALNKAKDINPNSEILEETAGELGLSEF